MRSISQINIQSNRHILALVSDAFGGHGGIALYMRDVLRCVIGWSEDIRVGLLARHGNEMVHVVPDQIDWKQGALQGKTSYLRSLISVLISSKKIDLVLCGHINLLPLAFLAAIRFRVPIVLFIYG